ncbi:MAG: FAD-dependent thymidylate synthase [Synergistaceae bacterium]|nr:FAD-dependent thymidylate synthase [Synergistaceae bacterium]MBQ3758832.1 FAD-dependent thymidylate synthase [Synergistaceae bacterium]
MNVTLLTAPASFKDMENFAALAALTCHANTEKDYVPHEVLGRIIKAGHESILEHINLTYSVKGLSRACLQELARHRHISLSVESTRHTLRKFLNEPKPLSTGDLDRHGKFGDMLFTLRRFAETYPDMPNDELKYYLPEFWPTNLILTANIRELRHIIRLRTAPAALREFRVLAYSLYEAVPDVFRYLLKDCVHNEADNNPD